MNQLFLQIYKKAFMKQNILIEKLLDMNLNLLCNLNSILRLDKEELEPIDKEILDTFYQTIELLLKSRLK